jgi:DNA-binding XRE family transcriptional regulator
MGLTIETLGAKADVHWTGISLIETGQRNPRWDVVCKLATGLEMEVAALARLADEQSRKGG